MTRKKLNLSYMDSDSMRKATFNKRTKGLLRNLNELTVLCGIDACAVIYSPFNTTPEVWPSNLGVKNVVERFEMLTEVEQEKKMVNHEGFLKEAISKSVENNNKKMKENAERTMKEAMFQLLSGEGEKLKLTNTNREDLCKYIDQYLKELYHHKKETLKQSRTEYGESSEATNVMAPTSIVEASSCSFPDLDALNSPRPTNDLWSSRPIISSSHITDGVNTFSGNDLSGVADQQDLYPVINPAGVYDHNPNFNHLSHNRYQYPIVPQDGIYNLSQNQDQQEENGWSQMMKPS